MTQARKPFPQRRVAAQASKMDATLVNPREETGAYGGAARPAPGAPFVCFAGLDWWYHNRAHSDFQLMLRIAQARDVLLINSLGMRMPIPGRSQKSGRRIVRKLRSIARGLRAPIPELPRFHVLSPLVLPLYGKPRIRAWSNQLVRRQVQRAMRRLGIEQPHVMVTVPTAFDVASSIQDRRSLVYNRSDKHSAFEESDAGVIHALEQQLFERADLVLYASRALRDAEQAELGSKAVLLDHGVDLSRFRPHQEHELHPEIQAIPRPRIGWFGTLREAVVDFALLERVARELPEAQLVLVGDATSEPGPWTALPNVHVLGRREHGEIPSLGAGFDVALMPWLQNDWVSNANPIKLKEYLALGLPIVSTEFPELAQHEGIIHIAKDADHFVAEIKSILSGQARGSVEARCQAVARSDWLARAAELTELCDRIAEARR